MLARKIFDAALDIDDLVERSRFIDQHCGGDADLRDHLHGLIDAHQNLGDFLDPPHTLIEAIGDHETIVAGGGPQPTIKNYQLIKQIGDGGMGVVYLAEQLRPVRRQVALKVIKPGMDSNEVVARFEAERQTLASMDHSNIARVFDGGTTDQGYPYFAMELVQGLPITDYCREHGCSIEQRLSLFQQVCRGVQHAHQKGVIHRDIKPSNIIVVQHDRVANVKVIDFGIAKAIQNGSTETPLVTSPGQWIGTPVYMSPEQASSGLDVDTRSDVYSLGVLLYELLSNQTPLNAERIKGLGPVELQRLIQDQPVPKPSSAAGDAVSGSISNELDWIVLRALEKDRQRRYQSVIEFADDIQRYLANRPVAACPPSLLYTVRKFAKRNLVPLTAATVVVVALFSGTSVSTWQAIEATSAARQADAQRQLAEQSRMSAIASQLEADQQRSRAEDNLLESFAIATLIDDELRNRPGTELLRVELLTATLDHFDLLFENAELNQDHLRSLAAVYNRSAALRQTIGDRQTAIIEQQKALQIYQRLAEENPHDPDLLVAIAKARIDIGYNHKSLRNLDEGLEICESEIENLQGLIARFPNHRGLKFQLTRAYNNAGATLGQMNQHKAAQEMLEKALPLRIELARGRPSAALAQLYNDIAYNQLNRSRPRAALVANRKALEMRKQLLRADPQSESRRSQVAASHNHLADVYRSMQRYQQALAEYETAIAIEKELVERNQARSNYKSRLANSYRNKAMVLDATGQHQEAIDVLQSSLELIDELCQIHPRWQVDKVQLLTSMARYSVATGDTDQARISLDRAMQLLATLQEQEVGDPRFLGTAPQNLYGALAEIELADGNFAEAEAAIYQRWELLERQRDSIDSVVSDFGKLAKAVLKSDLDTKQAKRLHDGYIRVAGLVVMQRMLKGRGRPIHLSRELMQAVQASGDVEITDGD